MAERAIGSIGSDGSIYYGGGVFGPSEAELILVSQNLNSPRKGHLPKFLRPFALAGSLGLAALACAPEQRGEVNAVGTVPAGVGTSQACDSEQFVREQGYHAIPVDIGSLPVEIDIIYRRDNQCLGRSTSDIVRVEDFLTRLEEQRRAEEVRQAAVAATAIAQAQAAEATATAQARPTETPTPRPTATSTPRPVPAPTSTPPRQEPTPEPREIVAPFPKEIDLGGGSKIINHGTRYGLWTGSGDLGVENLRYIREMIANYSKGQVINIQFFENTENFPYFSQSVPIGVEKQEPFSYCFGKRLGNGVEINYALNPKSLVKSIKSPSSDIAYFLEAMRTNDGNSEPRYEGKSIIDYLVNCKLIGRMYWPSDLSQLQAPGKVLLYR